MIDIKKHGKYTILIVNALNTYQQLYAQHKLMGFVDNDTRYQAMLELEKALIDIESDAVNEVKAKFK